MPNINITKKDIIWSYIAQFFSIASGLIVLPLILRMLSSEEIGMNYLMMTIGTLAALFDFGFAPQFGRNITYVFSGAKSLKKEGVEIAETKEVDYHLLANMIAVAKMVYRNISLIVLLFMLSFGTWYIYSITNGFSNIEHSLLIWITYSVSTFFNIYYSYYSSLLLGKGLIKESKYALLVSKIAYILLTVLLLILGLGLLGVTIANLISPFINRYLSYRYFYTLELNNEISKHVISKSEKKELFGIIWYNSKKLGLVFLGSYAINKFSLFIGGLYLSLTDIAEYGLMIQLFALITTVSIIFFKSHEPLFASLRVENNIDLLINKFSYTMAVYAVMFLAASIGLILLGPILLKIIGSSVALPSVSILLIYSIMIFLENNHSNFATFIVTENKIPFVESSLLSGIFIIIGSIVILKFTKMGILGLVLVQMLVQLAYSNWKWPYVVCRSFDISFFKFYNLGFRQLFAKICNTIKFKYQS